MPFDLSVTISMGGGTEFFWDYEDFVDIFWGHHKIGLYGAF